MYKRGTSLLNTTRMRKEAGLQKVKEQAGCHILAQLLHLFYIICEIDHESIFRAEMVTCVHEQSISRTRGNR